MNASCKESAALVKKISILMGTTPGRSASLEPATRLLFSRKPRNRTPSKTSISTTAVEQTTLSAVSRMATVLSLLRRLKSVPTSRTATGTPSLSVTGIRT